MLKKRERFVMFLLMYAVAGIYLIFWTISVHNETSGELKRAGLELNKIDKLPGWAVVLLVIGTLGVFSIVWQIYMCKKLVRLGGDDKTVPVIILLVIIFGLIFNPLVIQGEINRIIDRRGISETMKFS